MDNNNFELHLPRWKELPNIDLYIDQVVTLINETLAPILTKSDTEKNNLKQNMELIYR